jgi:hypothetical protein
MRKLFAACMALAAFSAFSIAPSVASASPELTDPAGVTLGVPSTLVGTNVGNTLMTTGIGTIECTKAVMHGKAIENTGTSIAGEIETATFTGVESEERCSGPLGAVKVTTRNLPWCLRASSKMTKDTFELRGGKCSEAAKVLTFVLHTSAGECQYSRQTVLGTIDTGTDLLTVSGVEFTRENSNFFCPSSGTLDMTFTLETTNGTPIIIS